MKVPEEAVTEFKALYKKEFGIKLSQEDAENEARDLLTLMALVLEKKDVI